ncbi:general vesicular transport factor p115-like isoform X2 [Temnothorax americanus]|uniref:general vesicular transport factor p115-like isoform X2 n=1 Tax=Temnothorax americanus TaxID=1964332 RepID=UPI00406799B3
MSNKDKTIPVTTCVACWKAPIIARQAFPRPVCRSHYQRPITHTSFETSSQHGEPNQVHRFVLSASATSATIVPSSSSPRNRVQRVRSVWEEAGGSAEATSRVETTDRRWKEISPRKKWSIKNSLKSVLETAPAGTQPTGADCRYGGETSGQTAVFYCAYDGRDACRALKALSGMYCVELGAQEMDALRQVLEINRTDCEIIGLALDTLCNITNPETFDEEVDKHGSKIQIGEQFTEIFIKHSDSVGLLLTFLKEFDFRVRWPALKLLTHLLANRSKDIQEIILVSPMGVSKLMDLLSDNRKVTRNDVLLLLIQLTKGNANIQKIVAFESAFGRIFDVIEQESNADGGIVLEDCPMLILNLRENVSDQHFKEGSYIQKLTSIFQILNETEDNNLGEWSPQKVSNVHCMVRVVRALVAPSPPAQVVAACQRTMRACGLLQALCDILMASGVINCQLHPLHGKNMKNS